MSAQSLPPKFKELDLAQVKPTVGHYTLTEDNLKTQEKDCREEMAIYSVRSWIAETILEDLPKVEDGGGHLTALTCLMQKDKELRVIEEDRLFTRLVNMVLRCRDLHIKALKPKPELENDHSSEEL